MSANNAIASANANPKIVYENNVFSKSGERAIEIINDPNTNPIPTPAPATPIVADPAPTGLNTVPVNINVKFVICLI